MCPPPNIYFRIRYVIYHEINSRGSWGTSIVSKFPFLREIYFNNCYPGSKGLIVAEVINPDESILTAINVYGQFDVENKGKYASHKMVFDRLKDFGLINCTEKFYGSHVQTHKHIKSEIEWQDDYLYASKTLDAKVSKCEVIKSKRNLELSDHFPVLVVT